MVRIAPAGRTVASRGDAAAIPHDKRSPQCGRHDPRRTPDVERRRRTVGHDTRHACVTCDAPQRFGREPSELRAIPAHTPNQRRAGSPFEHLEVHVDAHCRPVRGVLVRSPSPARPLHTTSPGRRRAIVPSSARRSGAGDPSRRATRSRGSRPPRDPIIRRSQPSHRATATRAVAAVRAARWPLPRRHHRRARRRRMKPAIGTRARLLAARGRNQLRLDLDDRRFTFGCARGGEHGRMLPRDRTGRERVGGCGQRRGRRARRTDAAAAPCVILPRWRSHAVMVDVSPCHAPLRSMVRTARSRWNSSRSTNIVNRATSTVASEAATLSIAASRSSNGSNICSYRTTPSGSAKGRTSPELSPPGTRGRACSR